MDWNEDNVERLKALHGEGLSSSRIARELGQGATRNMVISKLHRLGMTGGGGFSGRKASTGGGGPTRPSDAIVAIRKPKPGPRLAVLVDEPAPKTGEDGQPITLRNATSKQCRWMAGDPAGGEAPLCGHDTLPNQPWCEHHAARLRNATAMQQLKRSLDAVPTVKARALKHA